MTHSTNQHQIKTYRQKLDLNQYRSLFLAEIFNCFNGNSKFQQTKTILRNFTIGVFLKKTVLILQFQK